MRTAGIILLLIILNSGLCQKRIYINDIKKEDIKKGLIISLPEIFFDYSQSTLIKERYDSLEVPDTVYTLYGSQNNDKNYHVVYKRMTYSSHNVLSQIVSFLYKYPKTRIEIGVHCDCRWSPLYSQCLTCRRASSLKGALEAFDIIPGRLVSKGYNESEPLPGLNCEDIEKLNTEESKEAAHARNRRVELKIISTDYLDSSIVFTGCDGQRDIYVYSKLKPGDCFRIPVTFTIDGGSRITSKSEMYLGYIANLLLTSDTFQITIENHTDCRGSDTFNKHLSIHRAQQVANYLIESYDLNDKSIQAIGWGEEQPCQENTCEKIESEISSGKRAELHALNRRTLLKIVHTQ